MPLSNALSCSVLDREQSLSSAMLADVRSLCRFLSHR